MNSQKRISVYMLLCSDSTYYKGVTNNVARRFEEHSEDLDKNSYTYYRRPLKLVFEMSFADFNLAIHWEK